MIVPFSVTLVIPGRNCGKTLDRCLQSVVPLKQSGELKEIIFVDDGSTDDTKEIATHYPVRVIAGTGRGPGAARNLGWQAADSELIWFIDSDCVAHRDALSKLLVHFADPVGVPALAGMNPDSDRLKPGHQRATIAGVGGSYSNLFPENLLASLIHEEIIARHRRMDREVDFLATFNVVYRRSGLQKTQGFNESLKLAQDAELAYRVRASGDRLNFVLDSRVGHHHPTRLWRYLKTQFRQGYYRVRLYREHPSKISGDSYAGIVDYLQPPLACLSVLLLVGAAFIRWSLYAFGICFVFLAVLQLPWVFRVAPTMGLRSLTFIPFGIMRAFARGFGMVGGAIAALPHGADDGSSQ